MRPPFSFFLKKRMRRARWKRKSLGRRHFRLRLKRLFPPVTRGLGVLTCWLCPFVHIRKFHQLGALPDAPCSSFAAAVRWLRKTGKGASGDLRECQGAAAKRERQSIRAGLRLSQLPYVVEWAKAIDHYRANPPYKALRAFRTKPGMPPPEPFSLTPSNGAFSFSSPGKREWGF